MGTNEIRTNEISESEISESGASGNDREPDVPELPGTKVGDTIRLCPDGVYRWYYEMRMLKNPTILFTVWKVLGIAFGIVYALTVIINLADRSFLTPAALLGTTKVFLILIAVIFAVSILAYLIVAAVFGWKYVVLFEMTETYVRHIQMPRQVRRAEALGYLASLVGSMAGRPSAVGAGILASAKNVSTSEFQNVRSVKALRKRDVIYVSQTLEKNQVYASGADFDFAEKFIKDRCANAKKR